MNTELYALPFHIDNTRLASEQISLYYSSLIEDPFRIYEYNPFLDIHGYQLYEQPLYWFTIQNHPISEVEELPIWLTRVNPIEAFKNRQLLEQLPFYGEEYGQVGPTTFIQDVIHYFL